MDKRLYLRPGSLIRDHVHGCTYRVAELLGYGGFGAAYKAVQLRKGGAPDDASIFCLKIAVAPNAWSHEAYFGDLLSRVEGVLSVYSSFAWACPSRTRDPLYCLITELATGGDLANWLRGHPAPWDESAARREIMRLLSAVKRLHDSGAVHRDITASNVFVCSNGKLKLGDFGIAFHRVGKRYVLADAFAPYFAPSGVAFTGKGEWRPSDDVYHLGKLFAYLLSGSTAKITARNVKELPCSSQAKAVIQRCIGPRRKRFQDAARMLDALRKQEPAAKRSRINSLAGQRVVFTGALRIPRSEAKKLVRRAGGIVQRAVAHNTTLLVVGKNSPHFKADTKGQKLLDLDREYERGHRIPMIGEARFLALTPSGEPCV